MNIVLPSSFTRVKVNFAGLIGSIVFFLYAKLQVPAVHINIDNQYTTNNITQNVILITGGAGFIGYHVAATLSKSHKVIILDNFNNYYDVQLKKDRAFILHKMGVEVYSKDLCNGTFLEEIFKRYNFTNVIHMAAQAGVRYSLKNPLAYIKSNVECHLMLLNVLKRYKDIHLIYASSSSVYGKEAKVPFHLSARTDHPGNMYAATKTTDELLGLYYCKTYNISMVGLRFFTVYGPWGRPDMSIYKFVDAILNGKSIPVFHSSDEISLSRDFTYIDDIVNGVMSAMDYIPNRCGAIFNLGYGNPVLVQEMISIIEDETDQKASVEKLPLPQSELLQTWADISLSKQYLGFKPLVNLTSGIQKFVSWYQLYKKQVEKEKQYNRLTESEKWFASL